MQCRLSDRKRSIGLGRNTFPKQETESFRGVLKFLSNQHIKFLFLISYQAFKNYVLFCGTRRGCSAIMLLWDTSKTGSWIVRHSSNKMICLSSLNASETNCAGRMFQNFHSAVTTTPTNQTKALFPVITKCISWQVDHAYHVHKKHVWSNDFPHSMSFCHIILLWISIKLLWLKCQLHSSLHYVWMQCVDFLQLQPLMLACLCFFVEQHISLSVNWNGFIEETEW